MQTTTATTTATTTSKLSSKIMNNTLYINKIQNNNKSNSNAIIDDLKTGLYNNNYSYTNVTTTINHSNQVPPSLKPSSVNLEDYKSAKIEES